jgi:nucleoside phosphorylase
MSGRHGTSGASRASGPTAIVSPLAIELAGVLAAVEAPRMLRVPVSGGDGPAPGGGGQAPGGVGKAPGNVGQATRGDGQASSGAGQAPRGDGQAFGGDGRAPGGDGRWRGLRATIGRLGGEEVALMATGDGAEAAAAGLHALVAALRPRRLLVLGVAGGLTPGLAAGTLVAARRVVAGDGSAVPRDPDGDWLALALACGATAGIAVSVTRLVVSPGAKQEAFRKAIAPAAGSAAAFSRAPIATADLESAAYARVAAARSIPYLVVRAVLDPVEETLPLDFEACRDATGRVSNARVVLRALSRPRSFADLWRLRGRVRDAAARLGALAERLVAATEVSGLPEELGAAETAVPGRRRA